MRTEIIRKKIAEIQESLEILRDNLPESLPEFVSLGLVKDGMYKGSVHEYELRSRLET